MTWVAAEAAGNELAGFGYGARVEYDLTDGTTVRGKIVVPGTDKIGSAHGIELDTDVQPCELHWIGTGLVRPESTGRPAPAAPRGPKLTGPQERALDQLKGTLHGQVRKGSGIQLATARVLHRLGLAYLIENYFSDGSWLLVLVEPEVQEITDDQLLELSVEEASLLAPLDPKRRYRALRHAHIARKTYGEGELAVSYGDTGTSRAAVLRNRVALVTGWQEGRISDREYGRYLDLAGKQWKAAREVVTNLWNIGRSWGEGVLVVEATSRDEAHAKASKIIDADPVGYREMTGGRFGSRRLTVQEAVDARRLAAAAALAA